jgi:hypothetical protein
LEKDKVNGFRHHFFRLKQIKSTITMISFFFQFMSRADDMGTFFSNKGLTLIMLILLLLKSSRTIRQIAFQYGFKKVITCYNCWKKEIFIDINQQSYVLK